jgi:putative two-component system response regulator
LKNNTYSRSNILIVDDEPQNIRLLEKVLANAGYTNVQACSDSRSALSLIEQINPDLLLLDLSMPHVDGLKILEALAMREPPTFLPVLVLTADAGRPAREKSLELGAKDFLTKPFDITEVQLRVRNLLETKSFYERLRNQNEELDRRVRERTRELENAQFEILDRLTVTAEYRDDITGQHTKRVAEMAALVAQQLGLPDEEIALIKAAAPLHDVGKVAIPDAILLKPGPLSADEMDQMKQHTEIGAKILGGSDSVLLQTAEVIASSHHERWDGAGYGRSLKGNDIPIQGRIVAVADVFDALTHERPYKSAWSIDAARLLIKNGAGTQFDEDVVSAFIEVTQTDEDDDDGDTFSAFRSINAPIPEEQLQAESYV